MILAHLGDKKGYINIKEEVLIPFIYDDIGVYTKNGLAPAKKDGKYGYIDRKGKEVIPFEYARFSYFYESGLAIAKKNDKYGFIDKNGKEIIPIKYEKADKQMTDGVVLVSKDNKRAFFSNTGKQLTDFYFDRVIRNFAFIDGRTKTTFFSDKKVLAKKDAKWIYLDEELNELLSFGIFDEAEPFTENGFAIVMKDSVYGII